MSKYSLEKDIIEYIDYYNNKRIKGKLKEMNPVPYIDFILNIDMNEETEKRRNKK